MLLVSYRLERSNPEAGRIVIAFKKIWISGEITQRPRERENIYEQKADHEVTAFRLSLLQYYHISFVDYLTMLFVSRLYSAG
jgi:hypothetical protein